MGALAGRRRCSGCTTPACWAVLLPELEATVDFSQEAGRRHKDVWEHTKQVVRQSVPKPLVRWAALLHDIGKVPTRVMLPDGRVTFHRHAEVGARMFDTVARRLGFDRTERHKIRFLILHHLRANAYEPELDRRGRAPLRPRDGRAPGGSARPVARRRDVAPAGPAPGGGGATSTRSRSASWPSATWTRASRRCRPGLGNAIMEAFSLPPSRAIGDIRKLCQDAVERGELEERRDAAYYVDYPPEVRRHVVGCPTPAAGRRHLRGLDRFPVVEAALPRGFVALQQYGAPIAAGDADGQRERHALC